MVVLSASFHAIPNVVLVYSSKFCQMICYAFMASHLVLVKVRSILSIQMVHMVLPLNISQTLKVLLGEVGIFFPSIMCCQWRGLHGPFCLGFAFMMLMTPMEEVSCSPCNPTILLFKNLCAIFSGGTTHAQVTFIINVYNNSALHALFATALCQIDQIKAPSSLLHILSHTLLHFKFELRVRMSCHLVMIDIGGVLTIEGFSQHRV
jgi:hypothetical protein